MAGDDDEYGPGYGQWKRFRAQQKARQRLADAKRDIKRLIKERGSEPPPDELTQEPPPVDSGRHQSQRERMQELRARRREAGLVLVQVWVPRGTEGEVQEFARLCRAIEPVLANQPGAAKGQASKHNIDQPVHLPKSKDGNERS